MKLIFFRHGEAENPTEDSCDFERRLTPQGIASVQNSSKLLKAMISGINEVTIWSSPLIRAVETADLLAAELNVTKVKKINALGKAGFRKIIEKIQKKDFSDASCLILVGHIPALDKWSSRLTGTELSFGKSAFAIFNLKSNLKKRAKIDFFAAPEYLKIFAGQILPLQDDSEEASFETENSGSFDQEIAMDCDDDNGQISSFEREEMLEEISDEVTDEDQEASQNSDEG
ncbi:MAG: hypothetical protein HGA49_02435 [Eubacteriaceae bacterium]|nr:hypothetical protein [Eubacteriaceae bacterium]